jgi:hypothetical protein
MSEIKSDLKAFPVFNVYKGSDFKNVQLWKVLNYAMNHHGFQYRVGLNTLGKNWCGDNEPFRPEGKCQAGGLYVTSNPIMYLSYGDYIARVTLPPDAQVWVEPDDKLKCDKLILANPVHISAAGLNWDEIVRVRVDLLAFHPNPSTEFSLEIIKKYPWLLGNVKNITEEMCVQVIRRDPYAM